MNYTSKNVETVNAIIAILAERHCTIDEARKVLGEVSRVITATSTVQPYVWEYES